MKPVFHVNTADPTPLYAQIERTIRSAIATGRLRAGDQLPTVRQLAVDLRVNANTVAKVYAELERVGVVDTRRGVGTFVCEPDTTPAPRADRERALRALVEQFLAGAAANGFSATEAAEYLMTRLHGQGRNPAS